MALLVCLVAFLAISQALLVNVTRCPSDLKPDGDWSHLTTLKDFYLAEVRPLQRAKQQTGTLFMFDFCVFLLRAAVDTSDCLTSSQSMTLSILFFFWTSN